MKYQFITTRNKGLVDRCDYTINAKSMRDAINKFIFYNILTNLRVLFLEADVFVRVNNREITQKYMDSRSRHLKITVSQPSSFMTKVISVDVAKVI